MKNKIADHWDLIITPYRGWFELHLVEIWKYKYLLWLFVKRDFTTFYKQTILGPLWFFIQPLISTIIFNIIFNRIANIPTGKLPPILFYMSGIIAWNYFSGCLIMTSNTFTVNARLFGKVYFPRIIVPISKVVSELVKFAVQLIMFLAFYFYYFFMGNNYINPSLITLLLLPFMIFQMALLSLGIGMIISSLTTKYRDLSYIINFGIQLLMYMSPIVYPLSVVPEKYKKIILINPMTPVIEGFRQAFINDGQLEINIFIYSICFTLVTLFFGILIFNKVEQSFIDTV